MPARTPVPSRPKVTASEKLVEAAAIVFARDGLSSATTREIARTAGVNEVTLFRNFQTKQNLLAAVLEKAFERKTNPLAEKFDSLPERASLREVIAAFAEADYSSLKQNVSLMRVLVGEIQKFEEHEMKVLRAIFRPRRDQLTKRLRDAQARGEVIADVNPAIVVDQLVGMIFTHVLRSDCPFKLEYKQDQYVRACVDLIVRGISSSRK
ncbi:TetR/AcrR family transcriptional regulator [Luteolibacter ambystomatis]|uniref:TetR/AcrR family transcriptional regulator n=1 Tax=Luteolibacter ambystomatis TaxID=2824561 RepID=A0A975J1R3_9BACT|nr:TetR/AcrR family transcriptional regulator [Luteolibacter ambystomatis]QUE52428.1 TetR/AcrR family transcriptional regulator [Luteolibacter ambystomatis]